ncbi:molecular chaperone HscC [Pelomonas sp. HMWF004]|nr:molecular chaperone HscC [Pelomonas sp. HMWF004]
MSSAHSAHPAAPEIVGIDLGTTNSLVAFWHEGSSHLVPNALGKSITPSAVSLDADGSVLVGEAARERLQTHPALSAAGFKRGMGSDRQYRLGDRGFRAEELSALVLTSLRADVRTFFGSDVDRAVITVPAYFSDAQRAATRNAGLMAGFTDVSLLNEPTAAALAYGLHTQGDAQFLVFDFGGGTFDVSILELFCGVMEVRATAGDNTLGGDDVDACLERWVFESADLPASLRDDAPFMARLKVQCETAKRALSRHDEVRIAFRHEQWTIDLALSLSRLEQLIKPLLERLRGPVEVAVRDARLNPQQLSAVVLAGGSSRLRAVRQLVTLLFGQFPNTSHNPDEVVALGAAVQAGLRAEAADLAERVMTDVCPYTLGVAISKQLTPGRNVEGFMSPVLARNLVVPTSRMERYYPVNAEQTVVRLRVFQGEARLVKDNIALGELEVQLPPPQGDTQRAVDVRFTYDADGLLEVEATPLRDGLPWGPIRRLVLQNSSHRLSQEEVQTRLQQLALLKLHPRDRLEMRTLMARAERLHMQLNGDARQQLADIISHFELALESQDERRIKPVRDTLRRELDAHEASSPLGAW